MVGLATPLPQFPGQWPASSAKRSGNENMYSILQHGLINNLNERAAFGEGTYLSTEIDVALGFSPSQRVRIPVRYLCKVRFKFNQ
mgnify:CR=1 FL=1